MDARILNDKGEIIKMERLREGIRIRGKRDHAQNEHLDGE